MTKVVFGGPTGVKDLEKSLFRVLDFIVRLA
jgi:hypothetical protein